MRIRIAAPIPFCLLALTACGSTGGRSAALVRPASPINLSVYVTDSRISVYPGSAGAGQVIFTFANQGSRSEALAIADAGGSRTLASTPPINPQGTTQLNVNLHPGRYTISIDPQGRNQAQRSVVSSIQPASLRIGRRRPNSSDELMQP